MSLRRTGQNSIQHCSAFLEPALVSHQKGCEQREHRFLKFHRPLPCRQNRLLLLLRPPQKQNTHQNGSSPTRHRQVLLAFLQMFVNGITHSFVSRKDYANFLQRLYFPLVPIRNRHPEGIIRPCQEAKRRHPDVGTSSLAKKRFKVLRKRCRCRIEIARSNPRIRQIKKNVPRRTRIPLLPSAKLPFSVRQIAGFNGLPDSLDPLTALILRARVGCLSPEPSQYMCLQRPDPVALRGGPSVKFSRQLAGALFDPPPQVRKFGETRNKAVHRPQREFGRGTVLGIRRNKRFHFI